MDKTYDPHAIEQRWYQTWEERGWFEPDPAAAERLRTYPIHSVAIGTVEVGDPRTGQLVPDGHSIDPVKPVSVGCESIDARQTGLLPEGNGVAPIPFTIAMTESPLRKGRSLTISSVIMATISFAEAIGIR